MFSLRPFVSFGFSFFRIFRFAIFRRFVKAKCHKSSTENQFYIFGGHRSVGIALMEFQSFLHIVHWTVFRVGNVKQLFIILMRNGYYDDLVLGRKSNLLTFYGYTIADCAELHEEILMNLFTTLLLLASTHFNFVLQSSVNKTYLLIDSRWIVLAHRHHFCYALACWTTIYCCKQTMMISMFTIYVCLFASMQLSTPLFNLFPFSIQQFVSFVLIPADITAFVMKLCCICSELRLNGWVRCVSQRNRPVTCTMPSARAPNYLISLA